MDERKVPVDGCRSVVARLAVLTFFGLALAAEPARPQARGGPSAFCHVTDGAFTVCPGGGQEWSDLQPAVFLASQSYLYADQGDLDPVLGSPGSGLDTFLLMYDDCARTVPLGPDEYVRVTFKTVEVEDGAEKLEHYVLYLFADGTLVFFEDGDLESDEEGKTRARTIEGQTGAVSFGPSPNCPFDHVLAEFEIRLSGVGAEVDGAYSPDPLFWSSGLPGGGGEDSACRVTITGGAAKMNTGELARFTATVAGGGAPVLYQWSVDGAVLKDYRETTRLPWAVTPMAPADFRNRTLSFYWKPPLGPRKVAVEVTAGNARCRAETTLEVERSAEIDRQAEDFYTSNHAGLVANEHAGWHQGNPAAGGTYSGSLFFDFHHEFIARFNSWRAEFGFPQVAIWDPATALPTGAEVAHNNRGGAYTPQPRPSWFTRTGTVARPGNGLACDTTRGGETRLANYPADRNLLGCAVTSPWHDRVHGAVGGDMTRFRNAPLDPIFWRWHNFVDGISQERQGLTPPTVVYQAPFRLFRFITGIPSASVTFSEPVTGVSADDLRVNGSLATAVSGAGAGPYEFTGFAPPPLGPVTVEVAPGGIADANGELFTGASWSYTLIDGNLDTDGDGTGNAEEAEFALTDPTDPDTDDDGLPDGFEIANACLEPLEDQAHPPEHHGPPGPGDDDADDDGKTDAEELLAGTDPCSAVEGLFGTDGSGGNLLALDPRTGAGAAIGFMGVGAVPSLALDPRTGILYAGGGGGGPDIYTVDSTTGQATLIGSSGLGVAAVGALDFGPDGRLYGAVNIAGDGGTGSDHLAVFDTATGAATVIGPFGQCSGVTVPSSGGGECTIDGMEAIAFDAAGRLWGALSARGAAGLQGLYSIDPATGTAAFLRPILDAIGNPPPGGVVSLAFCGDALFAGTGRSVGGGRLLTLDPEDGRFAFVGPVAATSRPSLAALACRQGPQGPPPPPPPRDSDGDGVPDAFDNCPAIANADQLDSSLDGIGDACATPGLEHATAAFLQALPDGSTVVEPRPLPVSAEPDLVEQLVRIVEFRLEAGLANSAEELTANLVDSLVEAGVVSPESAGDLTRDVIEQLDGDGDGIPDLRDECAGSDLRPTVVIASCDSGVPNQPLGGGCTLSDRIAACAAGAPNHGAFVRCVSDLTNRLRREGILSGNQKGAIESCAARAKRGTTSG